ncbi:MAG: cytochrome c [Planctomycetes bacterium]|nr:cytochrome c [Planctomycetota bacterium]
MHMRLIATLLASMGLLGCGEPGSVPSAPPAAVSPALAPPALDDPQPHGYLGLDNVVAYAERVYSGSAPLGPEGFQTLAAWGVDTIISVDGARPDVETARAAGLRYVHLPIGYDGMDAERTLELARALQLARERGAVYVHCHHGKHRSAGAAGAASVTLGLASPAEATARMQVSGTSPSYPGLYGCVALATPTTAARLDALPTEFPEVWEPQGLVKSMVEVAHAFEHLQDVREAGWRAPASHPDLVPAAEAGRLADLFRTLDTAGRPDDFQAWARESQRLASEVEEALVGGGFATDELDSRLQRLGQTCKACHAPYRNR